MQTNMKRTTKRAAGKVARKAPKKPQQKATRAIASKPTKRAPKKNAPKANPTKCWANWERWFQKIAGGSILALLKHWLN
jgi:hypothetical protein